MSYGGGFGGGGRNNRGQHHAGQQRNYNQGGGWGRGGGGGGGSGGNNHRGHGGRGGGRGGGRDHKRPRQRFVPIGEMPIDQIYDTSMFSDPWESMTNVGKVPVAAPTGAPRPAAALPAQNAPVVAADIDPALNPALIEAMILQQRLTILVNRVCETFSVTTTTSAELDVFTALEQSVGAACDKYQVLANIIKQ